jgi:hypothetical protein
MHLEGLVMGASWLFPPSPLQCDDSDKESGDAKVAIVTLSTEYDEEALTSNCTSEGILHKCTSSEVPAFGARLCDEVFAKCGT